MQQRQPRLGDILDDYCPRERRITNHAVVAMIGEDIKQTRCTTCDAEHEYKHARVPRQRRKPDTPAALYAQVLADGPKRVVSPEVVPGVLKDAKQEDLSGARVWADDRGRRDSGERQGEQERAAAEAGGETGRETGNTAAGVVATSSPVQGGRGDVPDGPEAGEDDRPIHNEEGPVHRPLIRATLPRPEGQPPASRPLPEFTIRQPGTRGGARFRPRHGRGGSPFHGGRSNGNLAGGPLRGDHPHPHRPGGRPPATARPLRHQGHGRKRSK